MVQYFQLLSQDEISHYVRDGFDGPWSTFDIQLGTPPQKVAVLPSTFTSEIWVWNKSGCSGNSRTCFTGFTGFSVNDSSSAQQWNNTGGSNGNQTSLRSGNVSFQLGTFEDSYGDYCQSYMSKLGYKGSVIHAKESAAVPIRGSAPFQSSAGAYVLNSSDVGIGLLGMNQQFCRSRNRKDSYYEYPGVKQIEPSKSLAPNLIQSLLEEAQERGLGKVWSYTAGSYNRKETNSS
jgi:hypothetical protein